MSDKLIFSEAHKMLSRSEKEKLLKQKAKVSWLYGLSGSGKSSLALNLEKELHEKGYLVKILDGDTVRSGLNNNLGFSDEDRKENIRRIAQVAKLFVETGVVVIVSAISPMRNLRDSAREIIGNEDFNEIYVECSFEICKARDVKGLYKKESEGKVKKFTGKTSNFEAPDVLNNKNDVFVINTEKESLEKSLSKLIKFVISILVY